LPKKEYFFMVTESEFRAAMEGEENFIAYSLAKTYKTDLYLMLNQAYINKQYVDNLTAGQNASEAYRMAVAECNWHWSQNETIIVNATFTPEPAAGDKNDGLKYVEEEARKDFDTIEDVYKEDLQAIEKQKGSYFPLMSANDRLEEQCVHWGQWFNKNKVRT
jgi:hypothetical protein